MTPGEPVEARIKLTPLSHQLQPGTRLVLLVRPDNFPFVNPNTGEPVATATRMQPATVSVLHDAARPSRLILPEVDLDGAGAAG
jgi:predicted acyl esterase